MKLSLAGEDWDIIAEEQGAAVQEKRLFSLNSTKNKGQLFSPNNEDLNGSKKFVMPNGQPSLQTPKFPAGMKLQFGSGVGSMEIFYSSLGNEEEGAYSGEESLPIIGKERRINPNIKALRPITQETKDESLGTIPRVSVPELRPFDFASRGRVEEEKGAVIPSSRRRATGRGEEEEEFDEKESIVSFQ